MKKKILALSLCVVMLAVAIVGGTLAYFTDTTEAKVNEFTVGNVDIDLTEPKWDKDGNHTLMPGTSYAKDPTIKVGEKSQDAYVFLKLDMNKYVSLVNLMGVDAYKNNIGGLQGEYPGFIKFVNALATDNALRAAVVGRWFTGINHSDWKVMNDTEILAWVNGAADQTNPTKLEIVLGYIGSEKDTLKAGESVTFMTAFGMPETVTASMFDGADAYYIDGKSKSNFNTEASTFKMTFTAYAIQAAEIANIDAAYAALFK
ncbi:MAG: SipW-dependent-type signal peptide-containing protein [Candidatus Flemingiibacterium sp.]